MFAYLAFFRHTVAGHKAKQAYTLCPLCTTSNENNKYSTNTSIFKSGVQYCLFVIVSENYGYLAKIKAR